MRRIRIALGSLIWILFWMFASASPALAHEGPTDGAEWLMADWMLFSFLVFFLVALTAFVIALKRGLLSNLEDSKYHILTIDEPDYYTPDWVKEADNGSDG
jgi:hypothetical protein